MGTLDGDEVDSFYELIGAVVLMLFCAFAIGYMGSKMSSLINRYHHTDKIETTANAADINSPMVFTGYQAYMIAWMMDPYSDVSVTWMSDVAARTDGNDTRHITISTLDEDGNVISDFTPYRNQLITGGHLAPTVNVKSVLRKVFPSNVHAMYAHDTSKCEVLFKLTFTGDYTTNTTPYYAPDGSTIFDRRKEYTWIILPK